MAKRDTYLYGAASLINDASSEIVKSILPELVTNPVHAGIAGGLVEGLSEVFKFFFGMLSDKIGKRKSFILTGYLMSGMSRLGMALFRSPAAIIALLGIDRIGKSVRDSPRDASIAEKERNAFLGFSIQRAMDNIGAVIGVGLSVLLYPIMGMSVLWVSAAIGVLSFIPVWMTREVKPARANRKFRNYRKVLLLSVPALSNISYIFMAMAYPGMSAVLLYAVFNLSYALLVVPFSFESIIDKKYLLVLGSVIFPLSLLMAWQAANPYLSMTVFGIGYGLIKTSSKKIAAEVSDSKATAVGLLRSVSGMLSILSNFVAGVAWSFAGTATLAIFGIAGLFIAPLVFASILAWDRS